ncbi:hypothetical protein C8Q77DRAFT_1133222 [Trametes polyzona]|nr:hypothetical protein C8Q77DRAFT_1133222 [Trametes polyzona]
MQTQASVDVYPTGGNLPSYANIGPYTSAKISCFYDYHVEHDHVQFFRDATQHLTEWQGNRLIERANNGDLEAVLDMALRYLSGCGTPRATLEGALKVLDSLTNPDDPSGVYLGHLASDSILAQAHSFAAQIYFLKLTAPPDQLPDILVEERAFNRRDSLQAKGGDRALTALTFAVHHANQSTKLGLVSPIVLEVGLMMREVGAQLGVDLAQMSRTRLYRPLWRAITTRIEEIYEEERKKQSKVQRNPNEYVCAAEGCGVRAESRAALKSCAGKCPPDLKPHYCSKECQKRVSIPLTSCHNFIFTPNRLNLYQDWPRHKPVCKPGSSAGKPPAIADKAKALSLFELGDEEDSADEEPQERGRSVQRSEQRTADEQPLAHGSPGPGRIVDIPAPNLPGGTIQISSNTLTPDAMRSLRDEVSKQMNDEAAS